MPKADKPRNRYHAIFEHIFKKHWRKGQTEFVFERPEIEEAARKLNIALPKNIGDVLYSNRYRTALPKLIIDTQPEGLEWIIEGAGRAKYRFKLATATRIRPREDMARTLIPDATPEVIRLYKLGDEQALLAIVRYNRLIDIFLGLTSYSLQNHLRTTLAQGDQIEIDELYVGLDTDGCHYVIPVQAKRGKDQIGVVQIAQDIKYCEQRFPNMRCRPISAQFLKDDVIALFELIMQSDELRVVEERHYQLVPAIELDAQSIRSYRS